MLGNPDLKAALAARQAWVDDPSKSNLVGADGLPELKPCGAAAGRTDYRTAACGDACRPGKPSPPVDCTPALLRSIQ